MPTYISCDYCGKKIDTVPYIKALAEGVVYFRLINDAFIYVAGIETPQYPLETEEFPIPNGVFCSKKCLDEIKGCFVALETETQNVLARSVG